MGHLYISYVCAECLLYNDRDECWLEGGEDLECKLTLINSALSLYRCRMKEIDPAKGVAVLSGKEEDQRRFKNDFMR